MVRIWKQFRIILFSCFVIMISFGGNGSSSAFAEQRLIEATGTYTIGDGLDENISVAKDRAKTDALRNASEQAGVFVESLSVVQEAMLTKDEVKVISANIMQVQGTPKYKAVPISDDVIRYECQVTVVVDTDNVNAAMVQDKSALTDAVERNKELTAEVERLNKEMEQLRQKYAQASTDNERQQIRVDVQQNEAGFAATQLNEQGAKLFAEGRYGEAVVAFSQAIGKNPHYAYAYHNRGTAYGKLQKYDEAVQDFTQAISIKPDYATAFGGRGFAYYGLEDYDHAAADFSRAIELNPQYAEAYYGRGNAYMSMQHYQEALRDYEQALRINPKLDAARINRDMILQAL